MATNENDADIEAAERIYAQWADVVARHDVEALVDLFTPDGILESPLVNVLLESESGIVSGREQLRHFFTVLFSTKPVLTDRYRQSFFSNGSTMIWEYPRVTPDGEQADMAEVMQFADGKIRAHRVYWGWAGSKLLQNNKYAEAHKSKDAPLLP